MTTLIVTIKSLGMAVLIIAAFVFAIAPYTRWLAWFGFTVFIAYDTGHPALTALNSMLWAIFAFTTKLIDK